MMHVLNINTSLDFKVGAGAAERTFQVSRSLAKQGVQVTVLTLNINLDEKRVLALKPAKVVVLPCIWRRFYVPGFGWRKIRRLVDEADIIHLMSHWTLLNAIVYIAARLADKPYVVCPAGALPLFGRSGWLKRPYNRIIGNAIIRNASAWIAIAEQESRQFKDYNVPASDVTRIPNGVCEEDFQVVDVKPFLHQAGLSDSPMILFMGRLNPIKGPDLLLQAFILVKNQFPDYQLVFAGPDGGMLSGLREEAKSGGVADRVHFIGYVSGEDKSAAYRFARLLVVPSRQEAMSIVALEAGICGTPVLITDQCGFSDIGSVDNRLEVPANATEIADGLVSLLADPDVLEKITPAWHSFVEQRYTWNLIAPDFIRLYSSVLERKRVNE
jgi:glycosyltransferase involved in cell wall biosynthesis